MEPMQAPSLGVYAKPYGNSFSSGGGYYAGDFKPFLPWAPWDDVRNGNYVPIKDDIRNGNYVPITIGTWRLVC
eukprot:1158032-Pelagomonas_calceolata.AAC.10